MRWKELKKESIENNVIGLHRYLKIENCMVFTMRYFPILFPNIFLEDSTFRNYFRMTATQLEDLLQIIGPSLSKQTTSFREPISASERLCLTLRYVIINDNITIIINTLNSISINVLYSDQM